MPAEVGSRLSLAFGACPRIEKPRADTPFLSLSVAFVRALGTGMSGERLTEVLTVLYEVRSTLGMEKTRNEVNEKKQSSLERANSELAEENSKLKYQILHLKRNLESHLG